MEACLHFLLLHVHCVQRLRRDEGKHCLCGLVYNKVFVSSFSRAVLVFGSGSIFNGLVVRQPMEVDQG